MAADNSARKSAPGRPFAQGADPRRGVGKKGRSGRKPNWLKDWCDDLLARPETKGQVEEILRDKDHAAFRAMWQAVADRAHGKPAQPIQHSGEDGGPLTIKVVRE